MVLSIDLREGRLLSPDPAARGPVGARRHGAACTAPGLREAIVLDLARVGSGAGTDVALIAELHAAFPTSSCSPAAACATSTTCARCATPARPGALVATALHRGVIGRRELAELR